MFPARAKFVKLVYPVQSGSSLFHFHDNVILILKMLPMWRPRSVFWFLVHTCVWTLTVFAAAPRTAPVAGIRSHAPNVHVLTGARIVVAPGQVIDQGTIVFKDGVISQVGVEADVEIPAVAQVWNLTGRTVYPGFIEMYSVIDVPQKEPAAGSPYWNRQVQPQTSAARHYTIPKETNKNLRSQGITARLIVPGQGIIQGRSALVSTADSQVAHCILAADVALHMRLNTRADWHRKEYPNSPMGAMALARQALYDADWYFRAWQAYQGDTSLPQPEWNDSLQILQDYVNSSRLVIIDADNEQFLLRADEFAREFGLRVAICGSGHEYRRLAAVQETGRTLIVPVNFPKAPNVATPEGALNTTLAQLMHWDLAPDNLARLSDAGVSIALTSHGLPDISTFLQKVRVAVQRGLSADRALQALTVTPAGMLGVADRLGTIQPGKIANLIVTDGDVFAKETELLTTWVQGQRFEVKEQVRYDLRGHWELALSDNVPPRPAYTLELLGDPDQLKGNVLRQTGLDLPQEKPVKSELKNVVLRGERLGFVFGAEPFGQQGVAQASLIVTVADEHSATTPSIRFNGEIVWPDGIRNHVLGKIIKPTQGEEISKTKQKDGTSDTDVGNGDEGATPTLGDTPSSFAVNYPLGAYGRSQPPSQPQYVLFRDATIWTCSEKKILQHASLLIGDGKIIAVGTDLDLPDGTEVVDASELHITPGIIDCHSHMATDGGINESGQAITAEVRIGDFIDSRDISIYRQLAGGVTTANILHGSANPIGGQNQVIKLRWGALPEQLKFAQAPAGIKFALGENVKQSNWGDDYRSRYPQTRMGVEQLIRDTFRAANDYDREWSAWKQNRQGIPPRVDLELEAVREILAGQRWIHCHAYRQDEMLALLRVLEEFNVTIGTFQHVLEGYKMADELVRHGAMASAFSDWWAYKFEVFDAIPYNGALMSGAGVIVSFNSDSAELARHLNQEAAKALKYGNVTPDEALKWVTLHPARQLRMEQYVGSIEPGKHADLAVWTGSPMSNYSRCEQTWIDGRKYFDRQEDALQRQENERMHRALVQKILTLKVPMLDAGDSASDEKLHCPREDSCCHPHRR